MPSSNINPLWGICILVRFLFGMSIIARYIPRQLSAPILAAIGIGFATKYLMSKPDVVEFQIGKVFWNADRPIHATIYMFAALAAMMGREKVAGILVCVDIAFSIFQRFK